MTKPTFLIQLGSVLSFVACSGQDQSIEARPNEYASKTQRIESMNSPVTTGAALGAIQSSPLIRLSGTALVCTAPATDCKGVEFDGPSGTKVKIEDVKPGPYYQVSYRNSSPGSTSSPMCNIGGAGPLAVAISGIWEGFSSTSFMFACANTAAYHCQDSLHYDATTDHFKACVMMLRADYCGNGITATRTGFVEDVIDDIGINKAWDHPGWSFEAAWGPHGAVCIGGYRLGDPNLAPCMTAIGLAGCETMPWSSTVLLKSRTYDRIDFCGPCKTGYTCYCNWCQSTKSYPSCKEPFMDRLSKPER